MLHTPPDTNGFIAPKIHQAKRILSSPGSPSPPPRTTCFTLIHSRFPTPVTTSVVFSTISVSLRRWRENVWKTGRQAGRSFWDRKSEVLLLWSSRCLQSAALAAPSLLSVRAKVLSHWVTSGTRRTTSLLGRTSLSSSWTTLPSKTLAITVAWCPQRWHLNPHFIYFACKVMGEKSYAVRLSVNTSSPISCDWAEEAPEPGVGDQMVVRSQPELPRWK